MNLIAEYLTKNIKPSPTLMAEAKALDLKSQGHPVISLGAGEPDFDTPNNIKMAAIDAINKGFTKYTPVAGTKDLKTAIINKFKRENNLDYELNEISVGAGAKQVIYNALMASLNPKEEVIILAPFWVSYPEMVKIAGGVPVIVNCQPDDFSLPVLEIEKAITKETKWIILNSPNNPCGSVYSYDELRSLADMLLKHEHVHILSDDIYEHLVYVDEKFYTLAEVEPRLQNRILTVNGVSKTYAMTGWRIGYGAGPAELIKAMSVIQSQSTSNPCSISQVAAVEALNGPQDFIKTNLEVFKKRRDFASQLLNQIPGLKCASPKGAFYLFVHCSGLFGKTTPAGMMLKDSNDVANYLLEQVYVATVPGSAFGCEGFIRLSYAISDVNLEEACKRIKKACELLTYLA